MEDLGFVDTQFDGFVGFLTTALPGLNIAEENLLDFHDFVKTAYFDYSGGRPWSSSRFFISQPNPTKLSGNLGEVFISVLTKYRQKRIHRYGEILKNVSKNPK